MGRPLRVLGSTAGGPSCGPWESDAPASGAAADTAKRKRDASDVHVTEQERIKMEDRRPHWHRGPARRHRRVEPWRLPAPPPPSACDDRERAGAAGGSMSATLRISGEAPTARSALGLEPTCRGSGSVAPHASGRASRLLGQENHGPALEPAPAQDAPARRADPAAAPPAPTPPAEQLTRRELSGDP